MDMARLIVGWESNSGGGVKNCKIVNAKGKSQNGRFLQDLDIGGAGAIINQ
jgi:hypothetical protein